MSRNLAWIILATLLVSAPTESQGDAERQVTGTVHDSRGQPLPGVAVHVSRHPELEASRTDRNGRFGVAIDLIGGDDDWILLCKRGFASVRRRCGGGPVDFARGIARLATSMIEVGRYQELEVVQRVAVGVFLGSEADVALLPKKFVPSGTSLGDWLRVFVYRDSEDRLAATMLAPAATLGDIAVMEVVDESPHGAFVDWGLEKDLFVPTVEQEKPMRIGSWHVVHVRLDERTDRLIGSTRLGRFFDPEVAYLQPGREVDLLVWGFSELGTRVVVDLRHSGLVYASDTRRALEVGDELRGYVDRVRSDGKVDVSLRQRGRSAEIDAQSVILDALEAADGGFLPLHDKSSPEAIARRFAMSKRLFKAAVGGLYKRELIELASDGIRLRRGP